MNMQNRADETIDKNQQLRRNGRACSSLTARGGGFLQPDQASKYNLVVVIDIESARNSLGKKRNLKDVLAF